MCKGKFVFSALQDAAQCFLHDSVFVQKREKGYWHCERHSEYNNIFHQTVLKQHLNTVQSVLSLNNRLK